MLSLQEEIAWSRLWEAVETQKEDRGRIGLGRGGLSVQGAAGWFKDWDTCDGGPREARGHPHPTPTPVSGDA